MATTSYNIYQQITSVRLSATANLAGSYFNGQINNGIGSTLTSLSVGQLSIDGVLVNLGDRILLSQQTNVGQNGIYVVQNPGSPITLWQLQRAPDFQSLEQLKIGQYFSVGAGNTLAGNFYVLIDPLPTTIGMGAFHFVNIPSGGGSEGPFLTIANNLSDLSNVQSAFANIGLGSGQVILITDSDFSGGFYTLSNPCPNYVRALCSSSGNTIRLPPANGIDSFALSQGPVIDTLSGFNSVAVQDYAGGAVTTVTSPGSARFISTDNTTPQGSWAFRNQTYTVDGQSGDVLTVVQTWDGSTTPVNVTAGDGIDITGGVISLTGTGAQTAYGGAWVNANSFVQNWSDNTTWKGIRVDNLQAGRVNFTVTIDSSDQVYFQYTGTETAYFRIGLTNSIRTSTNTNPNSYSYSLGIDSGSGIVPIYSTDALMQFSTNGNLDLDAVLVPYNIIVQLNTGDKLYPIIQNKGDITPSNNEIIVRYLLADFEEIGDVGGTLSGVISLNGLTGVVGLTGSDGSVSINNSSPNINLSVGQFITVSATSQAMIQNQSYLCTNASLTSLSLPTTCIVGASLDVAGVGSGLFSITQGSGQQIFDGNSSTTLGATGHLDVTAANNYSAVKLLCIVANTTFMVVNSQGNFTPL